MSSLSLDEIRALLPELEELGPLLDGLQRRARPDEERRWTASGELGTVGQRHVGLDDLDEVVPAVVAVVRRHLSALYAASTRAVRAAAEGDAAAALDALLEAARLEVEAGRVREAEAFAEAALRMCTRIDDQRLALPSLLAGARLARAAGRLEAASSRYARALALARDAGEVGVAATAAIGLGNLAVDRGLWDLAGSRYDEAERWVARLPAGAPEAWHLALNRSIVAREEGRTEHAGQLLDRAEELAGPGAGEADRAILRNARGQLLLAAGDPEAAALAFRHALEAAEAPDARVTIRANLAEALLGSGDVLEAGEVARAAEDEALRAGIVPRLPEVYRVLGLVAAARGHQDAFVFFERSLEVVRERGLPDVERARIQEAYGEYDLARGEVETGRARLLEAARLYDELGFRLAEARVRAHLDRTAAPEAAGTGSPEGGSDDE